MAGTTWTILQKGKKVKSTQLNDNFDWLEGNLLPMNAGSTTSNAYDLGSDGERWRNLHLGTTAYIHGALVVDATTKIHLDGTTTGNTYIQESVADTIKFNMGANSIVFNSNGDIGISPTNKLYLDGGNNTYIAETSADVISIYTAGNQNVVINSAGDLAITPTAKIYIDGGNNTYIYESAADTMDFYAGGSNIMKLKATGATITGSLYVSATITASNLYVVNTISSSELIASNKTQGKILQASGDTAGAAGTLALTNQQISTSGATENIVICRAGKSGSFANEGYIKIYYSGATKYIPYWT